jgi:hypothetical protein
MFSKATVSSLASTCNWMKKIDPTDIPEPKHASRSDLNVHPLPYSKRSSFKRPSEKRVLAPPQRLFVDLYSDAKPSSLEVALKDPPSSSSASATSVKMNPNLPRKRSGGSRSRRNRRDEKKFKPIEIIDLTAPPSIESIRLNNNIYFTYDPRGLANNTTLPVGYCRHCRCPEPYCADKMFGKYCYQHMERLVSRMGFDYYRLERDIKWDFISQYMNLLEMKLTFNNIVIRNWKLDKDMEFPLCVSQGHYKTFLEDVKLWENRDSEENPPIVMEFVNDDDIEMGLPPLLKRKDSDSDDDVDEPSGTASRKASTDRTAVEQASDVGMMFKLVKHHLLERKVPKNSKVVNPYTKKK